MPEKIDPTQDSQVFYFLSHALAQVNQDELLYLINPGESMEVSLTVNGRELSLKKTVKDLMDVLRDDVDRLAAEKVMESFEMSVEPLKKMIAKAREGLKGKLQEVFHVDVDSDGDDD